MNKSTVKLHAAIKINKSYKKNSISLLQARWMAWCVSIFYFSFRSRETAILAEQIDRLKKSIQKEEEKATELELKSKCV